MKALPGQTLLDIAIQELGSTEAAYALAVINGVSVTDDVSGLDFILPGIVDIDIKTYYSNKAVMPATLVDQAIVVSNIVDTIIRSDIALQSNLIRVLEGQSFIDMAIQYCGTPLAAFDLAKLNGYSITDKPEAGALILKTGIIDKNIAAYYNTKALQPATGLKDELLEGIGYWAIGIDFIVS